MEIKITQGLDKAREAAEIRTEVFINEQDFKYEFDETDKTAFHAVLFTDNNIPAACGRIYPANNGTYAIGRIAVRKDFRSLGFGRKIITALEQKASELGAEKITLSAQTNASGFYKKLGYTPFGEEYLDEFCPHISMKKVL